MEEVDINKLDREKQAREIFDLQKQKVEIDNKIGELKAKSSELELSISNMRAGLLNDMRGHVFEFEVDGIVSTIMRKESVEYTDEAEVLKYLKNICNSNYIKVKVTESLDKAALKKALKTDLKLAEDLAAMTVRNVTEYVVVTDLENHKKMLEHINEQKS